VEVKKISIRLDEAEHKFLAARAEQTGQSVSAVVRSLIHSASLVEAVERAIAHSHDSLCARLSTPSSDAATRAALAAIIEHSLLPAAPMDRKPQLLAALKGLKS
jgi:uncharacterized protein (DUF1778 family)